MTALALALAYVATLAFVAFVMWMRAQKAPPPPGVLVERMDRLESGANAALEAHWKSINELSGKVSALQLAQGLRSEKRRDT